MLQGRLDPLEGVTAEQLRIKELIARVRDGDVQEVILAMNPTTEGETTIGHLREALDGLVPRLTVPARGLPPGAEIEFTDAGILGEAIRHRRSAQT